MARKHWYFGRFGYTPTAVTSNQMLMLPAPDSGLTATRSGYVENMAFENGGAGVVRSAAGARTYECDFGVANASGQSGLDSYTDMQQGYFGYSPVYVSDAMNYTTNVFPPNWAAPGISQQGWKPIYSSAPTAYPVRESTIVTSYEWAGTANASESIERVAGTETRRNRTRNPNATNNLNLWASRTNASITRVNDPISALPSVRFVTSSNDASIQFQTVNGSINNPDRATVSAGETLTGSILLRSDSANTGSMVARVVLDFYGPSGYAGAGTSASISLQPGALKTVSWESGAVPPGATMADIYLDIQSSPSGSIGYMRNGFIGKPGKYFDGDTPPSTFTDTSNQYRQPAFGATYNVTTPINTIPTGGNASVFIPIPPNHSLYMGVSGTRTGTGIVQARPVYRGGAFAPTVDLTMLSPTGATRLNTTFSGETFSGVVFYITRTSTAASTVTLTSLMAQIYQYYAPNDGLFPNTQIYPGVNLYPTASSVYSVYEPNGYFIPGRGQSGMEFSTEAIAESYTLVENSVTRPRRLKGMSFTVTEVTPWRGGTS